MCQIQRITTFIPGLHGVHRNWMYHSISIGCAIAVFGGLFTNIMSFIVLVRGRLWLKHEGYVYLAATFCVNVGILSFCTSSFCLTTISGIGHFYPPETSIFMCKVWYFFMNIFYATGWMCVALQFNVYLREHLIHRRRCGCPMFAAKYCTLFASKIIVGVIFRVVFVLGLPDLAIHKLHYGFLCIPSSATVFVVALYVKGITTWIVPLFLFLPIILLMTLCTKREGNTFGFSQIDERSTSDEQMRVVAVTLSSMTLFSQLVLMPSGYVPLAIHLACELLYGLSIAMYPILCFIILKALRDGFRSQLGNIRCCRRLFPSLDREEEAVRFTAIQEHPLIPAET